ncbi:MAG: F0F1 ATP synthase subunit gamma [Candidatus Omnitrophica bacterium]|nr:F0F1 ATP synthase subunit gamma [Candidatus Omnitrophota bacterium]
MIPLAELKQDLDLNKSLGSIIETMKTGSAIQLREFQTKARASDKLFSMLQDCFRTIAEKGSVKNPLFNGDKNLPSCIIAITSDDGFVGELNTFIINTALDQKVRADDEIVVLGERGANFFEDRNETFTAFPGISEDIKPPEIAGLKRHMIKGFLEKRFGTAVVVYPESSNVGSWKVSTAELLPFRESVISDGTRPIIDEELIIEPSVESVAEGLVHLWLNVALYNIFWASKFSEFGARLMHLEGSEQELVRMKQQLSLQYFKHIHAAADTTIREILSARLGLKS